MQTVSVEESKAVGISWKENIGWMGLVVTVGVMVQQVWMHFDSLAQYYVPKILSGRFFEILGSSDPLFTPLFKFVYPLEFVDVLFFFAFAVLALIQILRRKKAVPRILSLYMLIAGCYGAVHLVLAYLLPPELGMVTLMYTVETVIYLVVDVLLFLFYKKSRTFAELFTR